MKVVLVNPPGIRGKRFIREGRCMQSVASWAAIWPPITLASLAAVALDHGWETLLYDANVKADSDIPHLLGVLQTFGPDMVVINTSFPSVDIDRRCAAAIRKSIPKVFLLGHGMFFTLLGREAMEYCPELDAAITGEPETTFGEVLNKLSDHSGLSGVSGTLWRQEDKIQIEQPREFAPTLDSFPVPARELLQNSAYRLPHNGHTFTLVNVARGCPCGCSFCIASAYHGKRIRRHSVEYILDEVERCQRDLNIRDFLFWEEVFTFDADYSIALCEAIAQKGWDISWATTTRTNCVTPEVARAMKRAGCFLLGLGIESGNQAILDAANKNISVADAPRAVEICRTEGIQTVGHFVFGLPGETPDTAEATVRFALDLGLDYLQCYAAIPYPGTPLGDLARKNGWIKSDRWADYDFGGPSIMDTGEITPRQVDYFRKRLFRKFYMRPGYLLRQLKQLGRHPRQIMQAASFLQWT
jgi:radical SAM superfamily enzyme YgiQ (UPF0313 family)